MSAVVQPAQQDQPLVLSGAAALLWDLLEHPMSIDDAASMLGEACGMAVSGVRRELEPLVESLAELGVIESDLSC